MDLTLSDSDLAQKVKKESDNDALKELIYRHSGIFMDMVRRHAAKRLKSGQLQDLIDEKDFTIYRAAVEYDANKGSKFSTFLANKTRYLCLNEKTKAAKNSVLSSYDEIDFSQHDTEETLPDENCEMSEGMNRILSLIRSHADKRVSVLFEERYLNGYNYKLTPWAEIAPKVGLTTQGCINLHNRTLKELQKELKDEIKFRCSN